MQHDHHHSIHYRVERFMRHHILLGIVVGTMALAVFSFVKREDAALKYVYGESFNWMTKQMHHEHPTHGMAHARIVKLPTISGGWV